MAQLLINLREGGFNKLTISAQIVQIVSSTETFNWGLVTSLQHLLRDNEEGKEGVLIVLRKLCKGETRHMQFCSWYGKEGNNPDCPKNMGMKSQADFDLFVNSLEPLRNNDDFMEFGLPLTATNMPTHHDLPQQALETPNPNTDEGSRYVIPHRRPDYPTLDDKLVLERLSDTSTPPTIILKPLPAIATNNNTETDLQALLWETIMEANPETTPMTTNSLIIIPPSNQMPGLLPSPPNFPTINPSLRCFRWNSGLPHTAFMEGEW
eukprot:Cvel_23614.t1-p1 / transcript=Cvel_23614.t1 / gene=Cvel_23614 / organism=Chromera_velia_CCMP2878 / gene_product=hypothetical protein / transcript_product=hypothetical protein / location=Cvel_scaffold2452:17128-26336(+) / protein_length=264 / sequence_SO=supercontig / SO=protein_coding / is_pseudo=false